MSTVYFTPPVSNCEEKILLPDSNEPNRFHLCSSSAPSTQGQTNLVALVLETIQSPSHLKNAKACEELVNPIPELQLMQLPNETTLEILLFLPDTYLLKLRQICKQYKMIIDTTPQIQVKIVHLYLKKMQPQSNILTDDLKMDLTNHHLSVEVNNNLCLWKLTQSVRPQLYQTIPWISHLIIKQGQSKELTELFIKLHGKNRLSTLCLSDCEIDSETVKAFQSLRAPPVLHLNNLKPVGCTLPAELSTPSQETTMMHPNHAIDSIEKLLATQPDLIALRELEQQLQNESISAEQVLNKVKALHPIIQARIASSIWHSTLSSSATASLPSKEFIQQEANSFILQNPHHPAVYVAVKDSLEKII